MLIICPFVLRFMPCSSVLLCIAGPWLRQTAVSGSFITGFWLGWTMEETMTRDWRVRSGKIRVFLPSLLALCDILGKPLSASWFHLSLRPLSSGCGSDSSSLPLVSSVLLHWPLIFSALLSPLWQAPHVKFSLLKYLSSVFLPGPRWIRLPSKFPPYAANTSSSFIF